eukprot:GHVO01002410.1.p1 GENE.GHVO01002410.1~~GHVO01002410.1.p1  ORF type:complete len:241 (+),score=30.04 GHVO01002410.1:753-1475(+)
MGDPASRKSSQLERLRLQLKKKREALADQFDFKMFMLFHFKDQNKTCAAFEIAEVVPVMTNNYEDSILKGAKDEAYSLESSRELLDKDVVQLHAPRWQPLRNDIIGCTQDMDFFLWPRNDISHVEGFLFSRWKGVEQEPYRQLQAEFLFSHEDYEKQLMRLLTRRDKAGLIINNPNQSMFLFIDRQHMETQKNKAVVFKLSSVCLYLPQDQLMRWGSCTSDEMLTRILTAPAGHLTNGRW